MSFHGTGVDMSMQIGARVLAAVTVVAAAVSVVPPANATAGNQATAAERLDSQTKVRLASYNICKADCPTAPVSWSARRKAVFKTLRKSRADVMAVQEVSTKYAQRTQLARAMDKSGYTLASDGLVRRPADAGCTETCVRTTGILFKRGTVQNLQLPTGGPGSGVVSLKSLTGAAAWGNIPDRTFSWALLEHVPTRQPFLVASVHFANEKTPLGERSRQASARAVAEWLRNSARQWGFANIPLVVAGDLNSFELRNPRGAQRIFSQDGFVDGYDARRHKKGHFPTANHAYGSGGWPASPPTFTGEPPRIDYIFAAGVGQPVTYGVAVKQLRNGKFNPKYRGSDHNLVWSDWRFPQAN